MDLASRKGFDATTIEDVGRATDYHPSTFFRYFSSKEDAVFIGLREVTDEFRRRCRESGDDRWAVARDGLIDAVRTFASADPDLATRQMTLWTTDPGLATAMARYFVEWEEIITDLFAGEGEPDLRARLVGQALVATVRAAVGDGALRAETLGDQIERAAGMLADGLAHS